MTQRLGFSLRWFSEAGHLAGSVGGRETLDLGVVGLNPTLGVEITYLQMKS